MTKKQLKEIAMTKIPKECNPVNRQSIQVLILKKTLISNFEKNLIGSFVDC